MLGCLKLFLHRKSDFTSRHNIPECLAHTLFFINFVHLSRMLAYNEHHEINRTSVSYFFELYPVHKKRYIFPGSQAKHHHL